MSDIKIKFNKPTLKDLELNIKYYLEASSDTLKGHLRVCRIVGLEFEKHRDKLKEYNAQVRKASALKDYVPDYNTRKGLLKAIALDDGKRPADALFVGNMLVSWHGSRGKEGIDKQTPKAGKDAEVMYIRLHTRGPEAQMVNAFLNCKLGEE